MCLGGGRLTGCIGPHIGFEYAWPMSLLLQAMTSDNDTEISHCIKLVLSASPLGLIHESINVNRIHDYTRKCQLSPICHHFGGNNSDGQRELVRVGELRLRADDPRYREEETASYLWGGCRAVYSRLK